jgi:hypothetical protein
MTTSERDTSQRDASLRIDELIATMPDWRGDMVAQLRKIMHEADPEIVEEWKYRGTPVFSHSGMVCVITLLKNKVKVTFSEGARLADPDKVFNAGLEGNQWRAIDIYEGDKLNEDALRALVRSAVEYNLARAELAGKNRRGRR